MLHTAGTAERAHGPASTTSEHGGHSAPLVINSTIEQFTRWLALIGGLFTLAAIAITLISVTGRYALGAPVPGDYELVELTCAIGIFLFFPHTHATGGNIVVEFFTSRLTDRRKRFLDAVHDVVFAAVAALMAWRLAIGLSEKFLNGESTMLIRIPYWWSYSFAVASMMLLFVVCVARIVAGIRILRQ